MPAFRFLHAADLHLDSPFRGMKALPSSIRKRLKDSSFAALQNLIQLAIKQKVDFVLFSGDIYDLSDRPLRTQIRFQNAVTALVQQGIDVFVIHGNHDPLDGKQANLHWPQGVHFFSGQEVECVPVRDANGGILANIFGISYQASSVTQNLASLFPKGKQSSDPFQIGILHTNVDGNPQHDNYAPSSLQELKQSGIDYWALGHVHTRQVLHEQPAIVYPGNIQGRHIRETGAKGCYIVDVSEGGNVKLHFHATDTIRWFQEEIAIENIHDEQELRERIIDTMSAVYETAEGRSSMLRLSLHGRGKLHTLLQNVGYVQELMEDILEQEEMKAAHDQAFVWLESIRVQTGAAIDREQLLEEDSFLGDLLRIAKQLSQNKEEFSLFHEESLKPLLSNHKIAKRISLQDEDLEWLQTAEELAITLLMSEKDAGWEH